MSTGTITVEIDRARRAVQRRPRYVAHPTIAADAMIEAWFPYRFMGEPARLRVHVPLLYSTDKESVQLFATHATTTPGREEVAQDLLLDTRVLASAWAAARWSRKDVASVAFDVVRTSPPREPAPLRCGACKGTGAVLRQDVAPGSRCPDCSGTGVGGISRAACDTTTEVWDRMVARYPHLNPAAERIPAAELLKRLRGRGDTFAYRVITGIRPVDLSEWLADVRVLFIAAKTWARRDRWPRNPSACIGRRGPCPYRDYCRGRGEDDGTPYFQKVADPVAWDEEKP